jgi:uncharacterized protein YcfL
MKKLLLPALVLVCFICCGCSSVKDEEQKKGSIEKFTEKTGQDAAAALKKPVDKAKDIDKMARERVNNLDQQNTEKGE